jgi:ABC-type antimicrobial peptide transport system permease subunit
VKQIDERRLVGDQHQNLLTVQSFLVKAREALSDAIDEVVAEIGAMLDVIDQILPYLTPSEQAVYLRLWRLTHADAKSRCALRYEDLARLAHVSLSTLNFNTFSQVAFDFRVTWSLLGQGLVWALSIGLAGGLLPAVRAARLPVTEALRIG